MLIVVCQELDAQEIAKQIEDSKIPQEGVYTLDCGDIGDLSQYGIGKIDSTTGLRKLSNQEMNDLRGGVEL